MIPDTPIELAPLPSDGPIGAGYVWAVVPASGWELLADVDVERRCRWGRPSCKAPSVARLSRGSTGRWWHYCADHLYGHWILGGRVVGWRIRKVDK